MRKKLLIAAAAASMFMVPVSSAALAQDAPTQAPVAAKPYTTANTPLGVLLDDPAAKAIIDKYIPGLTASANIDRGRGMTLKVIQTYMPQKISDETLASIDAEFAKLPVSTPGQ